MKLECSPRSFPLKHCLSVKELQVNGLVRDKHNASKGLHLGALWIWSDEEYPNELEKTREKMNRLKG